MARADSNTYPLLASGSATGPGVPIRGGLYAFDVDGTAGGTTASLQVQFIGTGNWSDVTVAAGAAAVKSTTLPYGVSGIWLPACFVRCALTGGAPSGINANLVGLG